MKSLQKLKAAIGLLSLFLAALSTSQANSSYFTYTLDTSAYAGTSGYLAFDLIGGDLAASNWVSVTNLSTDGTLVDSGNFGLTDALFFNEVLRDIVLGTQLSFNFQLSENFSGGAPDSFSFYLLDSSFFAVFATADPTGTDALFAVDITSADGGSAGVYAGSLAVPDHGSTAGLLSGAMLALGAAMVLRRKALLAAA